MNAAQKQAVVQEFEEYIRNLFPHYSISGTAPLYKEVPFSDLMDTTRKYIADYSFFHPVLGIDIIVEKNGGQWTQGRHTRPGKTSKKGVTQYEDDLYKINLAQHNGYKIYQFTYEMLARQEYKDFI